MKNVLIWTLEIGVAAIVMWIDQRLFWLYFFGTVVAVINMRVDTLRKIIRFFQIANEVKLLAIADKLGVTPQELQRKADGIRQSMSPEEWDAVEKDLQPILGR